MATKVAKLSLLRRILLNSSQYRAARTMATTHNKKIPSQPQNGTNENDEDTHFGFETVKESEKGEKVYEVFHRVASTYDMMNDAMSVGVHRLWKDYFMAQLAPLPGTKLLDVAGGTGDIAFRFLKYVKNEGDFNVSQTDTVTDTSDYDIEIPREIEAQVYMDNKETPTADTETTKQTDTARTTNSATDSVKDSVGGHNEADSTISRTLSLGSHVTVFDINQAMLDVGKDKAGPLGHTSGVSFLKGNAECLPIPDNTYDAYTIAFGIRNCTHVDKVISEAYRVLKPGGRFMCLEFSHVDNPLLRTVYDEYSFQVIPVMGQLLARDWRSYQYLVESIRNFPKQEDFKVMIEAAGFCAVTYDNLTFGVAAIHSGFKL